MNDNHLLIKVLLVLVLCTVFLSMPGGPVSRRVAAQGSDGLGVKVTFGNGQDSQNSDNYQDMDVTVDLVNNATNGDLQTVDVELAVTDGAVFVSGGKFTPNAQDPKSAQDEEKVTPGADRHPKAKLHPSDGAVGVFTLTAVVTVDGQLRPDLTTSQSFTLGADVINRLRTNMPADALMQAFFDGQLSQAGANGKITVLLANPSDKDDNLSLTVKTYSGLAILGNSSPFTSNTVLHPGEIRIRTLDIQSAPNASPGRYTLSVSVQSQNQPGKSFASLIPVGVGPYVFQDPVDPKQGAEGLNLYVVTTAVPDVLTLASANSGQILVWVENTSNQDSTRDIELSVSDPVGTIELLDANGKSQTGDKYTRAIPNLQLGPQEAVLIPVQLSVPANTTPGTYSLQVTAHDATNGTIPPLQIWQKLELK